MNAFEKRRRYDRYRVEGLDVNAKMVFASEVKLENISVGGACILTSKNLKPNMTYLLKLDSGGIILSLGIAVVWERLIEQAKDGADNVIPVYRTGVKFMDLTTEKLVRLKDFIRLSGVPVEQRIGDEFTPAALRFVLQGDTETTLTYPAEYEVKKISLGGMLIRANYHFTTDRKFPMAIFLPDDPFPVKFQGRIASCIEVQDMDARLYDVGIEFFAIPEDDRLRLTSFIDQLASLPS